MYNSQLVILDVVTKKPLHQGCSGQGVGNIKVGALMNPIHETWGSP